MLPDKTQTFQSLVFFKCFKQYSDLRIFQAETRDSVVKSSIVCLKIIDHLPKLSLKSADEGGFFFLSPASTEPPFVTVALVSLLFLSEPSLFLFLTIEFFQLVFILLSFISHVLYLEGFLLL